MITKRKESMPLPMCNNASTLVARIYENAHLYPHVSALRSVHNDIDVSYCDLIFHIQKTARRLQQNNVRHGSRVVIISYNNPSTYVSVLACAFLGAIAVLSDPTIPRAAREKQILLTSPTVIVVPDDNGIFDNRPSSLFPEIPLLTVDITSPLPSVNLPIAQESFSENVSVDANDPLAILFTSGTTGDPKAVVLAHRSFSAIADILAQSNLTWLSWIPGEKSYTPLPASHIGGLWWVLNCLMHGSATVVGDPPDSSFQNVFTQHSLATVCLVPTLFSRCVAQWNAHTPPPPSLRQIVYGGSRVAVEDVRAVQNWGIRAVQIYGLSETGCTALCLPSTPDSLHEVQKGAIGRPYPGVETRISPAGQAPLVADSSLTSGTLWIKSPANMLGYWNNPTQTQKVLLDGWICTGDLVERDNDDLYYLRGRSSEMIISGGINIAPEEVDRIADSVPGVLDAACFEIADSEFGARVGLAVVPNSPLSLADQQELTRRIAATFRRESEPIARPSGIFCVSSIPRTASGKVKRYAVASVVSQHLSEVFYE